MNRRSFLVTSAAAAVGAPIAAIAAEPASVRPLTDFSAFRPVGRPIRVIDGVSPGIEPMFAEHFKIMQTMRRRGLQIDDRFIPEWRYGVADIIRARR